MDRARKRPKPLPPCPRYLLNPQTNTSSARPIDNHSHSHAYRLSPARQESNRRSLSTLQPVCRGQVPRVLNNSIALRLIPPGNISQPNRRNASVPGGWADVATKFSAQPHCHGLTSVPYWAESPARSMVGSAGRLPKWPTGADCKSAGLRLRWFESITYHHLCLQGKQRFFPNKSMVFGAALFSAPAFLCFCLRLRSLP